MAVGGLFGEASGDVLDGAAADELGAACIEFGRHQVHRLVEAAAGQPVEQRRNRRAWARPRPGELVEQAAEGARAPELVHEPAAPAFGHVDGVQERAHQAEVADAHPIGLQPRRGHGGHRQFQHFGIGAFGVAGAEQFDAGLVEFARVQR
jgi:hypothetical protein